MGRIRNDILINGHKRWTLYMQAWGLKLNPKNERIDWSHFSTDLVEF